MQITTIGYKLCITFLYDLKTTLLFDSKQYLYKKYQEAMHTSFLLVVIAKCHINQINTCERLIGPFNTIYQKILFH